MSTSLPKISFIVPTYNEASRITSILQHATRWADEVVIMDKGSTDETIGICRKFGDKVLVQTVPFSERGHEKLSEIPKLVQNDWVFLGTCSEIPTRELIASCRRLLQERETELDLVYVPRRMYAFGLHCSNPDWSVCHYPFLFHRFRARITDDVHDNFHAHEPIRTARIAYSENCCVHHMTYPNARAFYQASIQYFEAETKKDISPEKAIRQAFKNIERISKKVLLDGVNWIPFYCAFVSYELGKALYIWEAARGKDIGQRIYKNLTDEVLAREWAREPMNLAPTVEGQTLPSGKSLRPLAATLARLPYFLIRSTMLWQRFLIAISLKK